MKTQRHYQSYLLRLWNVAPASGGWRAMLENPSTGERLGFANLDALCAWIQDLAGEPEGGHTQLSSKEEE